MYRGCWFLEIFTPCGCMFKTRHHLTANGKNYFSIFLGVVGNHQNDEWEGKKSQICGAVSKARVPESMHYFKISHSQSMYKIQLQYLFYETCILGAENLRWHAKQEACICTIGNWVLHRTFSAYCKTYFSVFFLHTHFCEFASFGSLCLQKAAQIVM